MGIFCLCFYCCAVTKLAAFRMCSRLPNRRNFVEARTDGRVAFCLSICLSVCLSTDDISAFCGVLPRINKRAAGYAFHPSIYAICSCSCAFCTSRRAFRAPNCTSSATALASSASKTSSPCCFASRMRCLCSRTSRASRCDNSSSRRACSDSSIS